MNEPCRHERAAAQLKTSLSLMDDEVLMHSSNTLAALGAMHRAEDLVAERDATIGRVKALAHEWRISSPQIGTHWDGCHKVHSDCFVLAIRAALKGES